MRKSIFTLVVAVSAVGLLGALCQKTVTTDNTNTVTTINVTSNTNSSTNTSANTNVTVNTNTPTNTNTVINTNTTTNANTSVNTNATPEAVNATVTYNGSSFSASSVTITAGGTVTFLNNSTHTMQVSSNNHPTHTLNPEIGNGALVVPGETYRLTLTTKGTWGYHNHLNPSSTGTIIVQ